ncbi:TolC family protein, partial [bacterium]|nr:TolC family protein [bacterium]
TPLRRRVCARRTRALAMPSGGSAMRSGPSLPVFLFSAFLFAATPAHGEPPDDAADASAVDAILGRERIALADLFRLADLASPRVAAARADVSAMAGRLRQAGTYANPSLSFAIGEASVDDFSQRKQVVGIEQPLLLGHRRGPGTDTFAARFRATERSMDDVRRDVRGRIHALLIDVDHLRARGDVLAGLVAQAERMHDIARKRFEARAVPESHATRALLARYELEAERDRVEADRLGAIDELRALLGGLPVPADRLAPPPPLTGDLDAPRLADRLLATHPRIAAAEHGTEAARASHRWARARRLPDLSLRAGYGREVAPGEDFVEAGIGITLPLFDRNQGGIEEARAGVRQAEEHAREVGHELVARLAVAQRNHALAAKQLAAHRDTLEPAATRGLEQAEAAYRAGSRSLLELLDAQQTFARVRQGTLERQRDLDRAAAELARLAGLGPYAE